MSSFEMGRREFVGIGVGTLAVAGLGRVALGRKQLVRRSIPVMGTVAEIVVVGRDPQDSHAAIDAAFDELRFVERTMSRFDPESDVGRINQFAHRSQVTVDPVTFVVLWRAKQWASRTGGVFDPCLGRLSEMWDFRREVPPEAGVYGALANAKLYRTLELDPGNRGVRLTDARAKVDLGAIAKGFAVDRATAVLRTRGIRDALVNAGGDLYAMGRSADGDCWKVGVRDPANPDQTSLEIEAENVGIATSGDYQRYFEHQGVRYHHILDSSTGTPSRGGVHSITVKASNCCTADALATARFGRWVNPVQSTELLAEL